MKRINKVLAIIIASLLALTMMLPVFADVPESGSITVNGAKDGHTYTIYKMLDLNIGEAGGYSYKIAPKWSDFFTTGAGATYFDIVDYTGGATGEYVTPKDSFTEEAAATLAAAALAYAKTESNGVAEQHKNKEANTDLVFSELDLGYYLLDSSVGVLCGLTTAVPDATVNEKNETASIKKEAGILNDTVYTAESSVYPGQVIDYKVTITAKKGAQNYVFTDKMSSDLSFSGLVSVTKKSADVSTELTQDEEFTLDTPSSGDYTMKITFSEDFCNGLENDDEIIIIYKATVSTGAAANSVIDNKAKLTYGDNTTVGKDEETNKVAVGQINFFKYYGDNTALEGAKFTLSKNSDGSDPIKFSSSNSIYKEASTAGKTEIVSGADGYFKIQGLEPGVYYLTETSAPVGFNKLTAPIKLTVEFDGTNYTVKVGETAADNNLVKVENKAGSLLPTTGGKGTAAIIIVGCVLFAAAAVVLVTKKRMYNEG